MYYVSTSFLNHLGVILVVCILESIIYFGFACALNFAMKKSTIETIQTNTILRAFIAKTIHGKVI